MSDWTIEIAQLPIVASTGSHTFWVLKDSSGNTVREIQGFATGADGTAKTAGGPLTTSDTIRMHDLSRTDLSRADISTALPQSIFMSEWNGNNITSATAFSGTEAEVMARWGQVGPATEILNRLGVDYGPLTIGNNYNSNSVARYAGELMGLEDARPPNLAITNEDHPNGIPANAVGWNKELMDRVIDGVVSQIEAEEALLGRPLTDEELRPYVETIQTVADAHDECFGPEVPIDMWPLDPEFTPAPNNPHKIFDQEAVRAKIWKKPIELIRVGDYVVSHDKNGNMVPGYVPRTFQNAAKILLNFHGTRVTPGHVYYRPDSKKADKYETLIDVLRDDGMIEHRDGVKLRAATNVPVGDPRDDFIQAVTQSRKADGTLVQNDAGRIRLGTRFIVGEGEERKSFAVADLIEHGGGVVGDDELIRVGDGEPMPFLWEFSDTLPKPEDFVLACSGTTLEDIYKAAEWESQGPRLSAPMVLDRGPVQPLKGAALSAMPRNEPLDVMHAPMTSAKPRRTLNRKQRKVMEAKQRKAAKVHKRVAG